MSDKNIKDLEYLTAHNNLVNPGVKVRPRKSQLINK